MYQIQIQIQISVFLSRYFVFTFRFRLGLSLQLHSDSDSDSYLRSSFVFAIPRCCATAIQRRSSSIRHAPQVPEVRNAAVAFENRPAGHAPTDSCLRAPEVRTRGPLTPGSCLEGGSDGSEGAPCEEPPREEPSCDADEPASTEPRSDLLAPCDDDAPAPRPCKTDY